MLMWMKKCTFSGLDVKIFAFMNFPVLLYFTNKLMAVLSYEKNKEKL